MCSTRARETFELTFKTQMANKLGGGGVFNYQNIMIDSIQAGSVEVQFHVDVPATVQTHVASMVTTLAASNDTIDVIIDDST
eukprot:SAG31_NODE_33393_length_344_cov_0.844898_1_plen_81_part_01